MPEATVEPPVIDNPVIKPDFESAKSVFKQARSDLGLDKPPSSPAIPVETPTAPETPTDVALPGVASVLPDDVISPAPKEEPKTSEAIAAIEAMELPKGAKEKTQADFGKLKSVAKEQISKAEARIAELEQKASKSTSASEIEGLQTKIKEAQERADKIEEEFARVAFEHSPRFQAQFVKSEKSALESAKSYLEGSEIDPRIIDFAAHNTGKKRLEVLSNSGMDEKMIAAVTSHLAEYDRVQRNKSEALENWKTEDSRWQEEEQKRVETEKARKSETENKVFDSVLGKLTDDLPFRKSKDESWNSVSDGIRSEAKEAFNGKGVPLDVLADVMLRGFADRAGVKDKVITHLSEKLKTLESENAKLRSSAPGGVITQPNGTTPAVDPSKMNPVELQKQTFNQELARTRGA